MRTFVVTFLDDIDPVTPETIAVRTPDTTFVFRTNISKAIEVQGDYFNCCMIDESPVVKVWEKRAEGDAVTATFHDFAGIFDKTAMRDSDD